MSRLLDRYIHNKLVTYHPIIFCFVFYVQFRNISNFDVGVQVIGSTFLS